MVYRYLKRNVKICMLFCFLTNFIKMQGFMLDFSRKLNIYLAYLNAHSSAASVDTHRKIRSRLAGWLSR